MVASGTVDSPLGRDGERVGSSHGVRSLTIPAIPAEVEWSSDLTLP
jgi:hypothetical protein